MEPTLAEIRMFAGNFAPRNWALCQGQLLPIAQNQALFSLLGTMYGGDGRTTFALPDLRGRTALGTGQGPGLPNYPQGQKAGQTTVTLSTNTMPAHTHTFAPRASTSDADSNKPEGNFPAQTGTPSYHSTADANEGAGVTTNTGGNLDHDNMSPYTAIYYIICTQGLFPSRN